MQALALAHAPLAVVQPALAFNLVVLLVIGRRLHPDPVTRSDVIGALAITAGVRSPLRSLHRRAGETTGRGRWRWSPCSASLSVLPLLLRAPVLRVPVLLPVAAGIAFTLLAIATRFADDTVTGDRLARGCVLARDRRSRRLRRHRLRDERHAHAVATLVVPIVVSVESVLPIIVGPIALSEGLPGSAGARLVLALGIVAILAGVALLGRAPALAELRHEPA